MKVVINKCFGGFSLSPKAVRRMAELQGRKCYFFENDFETDSYKPIDAENMSGRFLFFQAFDIPNPNEVLKQKKEWNEMTDKEKKESHELYEKHELDSRPEDRTNPLLIKVVEELGDESGWKLC